MGGHTAQMSFWSRPLHSMTDAFTAAGFQVSVISEPQPVPEARALFPDDFDMIATAPSFCSSCCMPSDCCVSGCFSGGGARGNHPMRSCSRRPQRRL
jgi:hypothetical protein